MTAHSKRNVLCIWRPGVVLGVSMLGIVHMIAGDPLFVVVDACVVIAALLYLLPFQNKQEILRRGIALVFFAVGLIAAAWGDLVVQTWGLFLVLGAVIGVGPDLGDMFGRTAMGLYWGHASKLPPDYGTAKKREEVGDYNGALKIYRHYADSDPEDQNVRLKIALTYLVALRQPDVACYWFDKVLEYKRNNEHEVVASMEKLKIALSRDEIDEAGVIYSEMLDRFPNHLSTRSAVRMIEDATTSRKVEVSTFLS